VLRIIPHYVHLPTTDFGWAGSTEPLPKPLLIVGGENQRRAGARQAGRQPSLPVALRKRQRRVTSSNSGTEQVAEFTEHPAVVNFGTR